MVALAFERIESASEEDLRSLYVDNDRAPFQVSAVVELYLGGNWTKEQAIGRLEKLNTDETFVPPSLEEFKARK